VAYIYELDIIYPEGSHEPGWRPECWSDPRFLARIGRKGRKQLAARVFSWPRERRFLSSSGAYGRAGLLRWYGAEVTVRRSLPVEWPGADDIPLACAAETSWPAGLWPEFDASGIPLEPVPAFT
jgi:hypothetical protein